jgi:hypothetical protein
MPPKIAKLAGLGAFAASVGLAALWAYLMYVMRPTGRGGIDSTSAIVAWISLSGMFLALIGAHVVIGRRLLTAARGPDRL